MNSFQQQVEVLKKEKLGPEIFRLSFSAYDIAKNAKPGQFVMIKVSEQLDPLLRRPFSVHQVTNKGHLQILFKVIGKGTKTLSKLSPGDKVDMLGPLGNGFTTKKKESICLIGGGMGIAPILFLTKNILKEGNCKNLQILLGAQNKSEIANLLDNFEELGVEINHATDDGSSGYHGFVTELIEPTLKENKDAQWEVLCCGPSLMMGRVSTICQRNSWQCQVSMETMMACGIGACLGCTINRSDSKDETTGFLHVCKDGPVFKSEEIQWP